MTSRESEGTQAKEKERIYSPCPACGNSTLTLKKGRLLCTWLDCKNPLAADGKAIAPPDAPDSPLGGSLGEQTNLPSPVSVSKERLEAEKDKARLDWLQQHYLAVDDTNCRQTVKCGLLSATFDAPYPTLRSAIDAALGLKEEPSDHVGAETQKAFTEKTLTEPGWYWYLATGVNEACVLRVVRRGGELALQFIGGLQTQLYRGTYYGPIDTTALERVQGNTTSVSEPNENAGAPPVTQDSVSVPVKLVGAAPGEEANAFAQEWVQALEQTGYLDFDGGEDEEREDIICRLANKYAFSLASLRGELEEAKAKLAELGESMAERGDHG